MAEAGTIALAGLSKPKKPVVARKQPVLEPEPSAELDMAEDGTLTGDCLPGDCLEQAFALLEVADLAAAGSVCHEWRVLAAAADAPWRRAFLEKFGEAKAAEVASLRTWRDKYIACLQEAANTSMRSKARFLDELEDSEALVERQAAAATKRLDDLDRTLASRKRDLNALLASVAGGSGGGGGGKACHAESPRGKELLELAAAGGDLAACPALTPDLCAALGEAQKDVEFWRESIAHEREALRNLWDSLSYIQACVKKAQADVQALLRRRNSLEAAKRWRPNVRRT